MTILIGYTMGSVSCGGGFEPLISSCRFILRNPILSFLNLIYQCAEMNRWLFLHQKSAIWNVSFFIKVSDEEKFLLFQHGEIYDKSLMLSLIGMLDARMRIHDNIDPNWAIEVCKWSVTITIWANPWLVTLHFWLLNITFFILIT